MDNTNSGRVLYISDLHLFHKNLLKGMDRRGFASLDEMHEYIVKQWNAKVNDEDTVILMGDFSMDKAEPTMEMLKKLKGRKCLIEGNHDHRYLDSPAFDRSLFEWITPYKKIKDNKRVVILSHYPLLSYDSQFHRSKQGEYTTYMLYGHVHNTYDEYLVNKYIELCKNSDRFIKGCDHKIYTPAKLINTFCMYSDYTPLTLDEWIEVDAKRRACMKEEDFLISED